MTDPTANLACEHARQIGGRSGVSSVEPWFVLARAKTFAGELGEPGPLDLHDPPDSRRFDQYTARARAYSRTLARIPGTDLAVLEAAYEMTDRSSWAVESILNGAITILDQGA